MKCKVCNKPAIYGSGETGRCFEHLEEALKSPITYKEYHRPFKDEKENK